MTSFVNPIHLEFMIVIKLFWGIVLIQLVQFALITNGVPIIRRQLTKKVSLTKGNKITKD